MKKCNYVLVLLLIVVSCKGKAQSDNAPCNRESMVKSYVKKLPDELCLPKETVLYRVYDLEDIDSDGNLEIIVDYLDKELNDGDAIRTVIFSLSNNKEYKILKELTNLNVPFYPNHNDFYFEKKLKETGNEYLYNQLPGVYGLTQDYDFNLEFNNNLVIIDLNPGVGDYYHWQYKYDKMLNDWVMSESIYREEYLDVKEVYNLEIPNPAPKLSEFNLLDYL